MNFSILSPSYWTFSIFLNNQHHQKTEIISFWKTSQTLLTPISSSTLKPKVKSTEKHLNIAMSQWPNSCFIEVNRIGDDIHWSWEIGKRGSVCLLHHHRMYKSWRSSTAPVIQSNFLKPEEHISLSATYKTFILQNLLVYIFVYKSWDPKPWYEFLGPTRRFTVFEAVKTCWGISFARYE